MPAVTTPNTLPDDVAALRALVLTAWAERDAERAEKGRLVEERDQLAGQNDRLRHLLRQPAVLRQWGAVSTDVGGSRRAGDLRHRHRHRRYESEGHAAGR